MCIDFYLRHHNFAGGQCKESNQVIVQKIMTAITPKEQWMTIRELTNRRKLQIKYLNGIKTLNIHDLVKKKEKKNFIIDY